MTGERQRTETTKICVFKFRENKKIEIAPAGFSQIFSEGKRRERCSAECFGPLSLEIVQIG